MGDESIVENFVRENWAKLGLFLYFFPHGLGAGDATAIDRRGEVVGIEFEGNPYNYFKHKHHKNPEFKCVRYVFCHIINDEYDKRWAIEIQKLGKEVLSLDDLKRRVKERYNEPSAEIQERAKKKMEEYIGKYFRTVFPELKEIIVKL